MAESFRELKKQAKRELEEARILIRSARKKMSAEDKKRAKELLKAIEDSLGRKEMEGLEKALEEFKVFRDEHWAGIKINRAWETIKELFWVVLIVVLIRWLLIEPFRIPTGSMVPTLLVGDQLMVNKLVYGVQIPFTTKKLFNLKKPKRGEVVVFKYPKNPNQDYVKRVIGVSGDEVRVKDGWLYINDKAVEREYLGIYDGPIDGGFCLSYELYLEKIDGKEHEMILCQTSHFGDDYGPVIVPENSIFAMGDNRDNSEDSRSWGFVPLDNIKGKAMFIHLPLDPDNHYLPRWKRFFKRIR